MTDCYRPNCGLVFRFFGKSVKFSFYKTPVNDEGKPTAEHTAAGKRQPRKQTFRERWRRMSLPNKLMFFATVVIAFGTVVNVSVLVLQLASRDFWLS